MPKAALIPSQQQPLTMKIEEESKHVSPIQADLFTYNQMIMHHLLNQVYHPRLGYPWYPPPTVNRPEPELTLERVGKKRKTLNNNCLSPTATVTSSTKITTVQEKVPDHPAHRPEGMLSSPGVSQPFPSPPQSTSTPSPQSSGSENTKEQGRERQFTCKICNRSFGYKHVLQNHERTHTGEKPFECKECHKRFTRDHHLKTHMRLHTGERPYRCTTCDRQFVQVANLRRHVRVHTGERPYTCEWCSSKFSDSNQLKAHVLTHTDQKPYSCDKCHNRFRRRHHLSNHKCTQIVPITVKTELYTDLPEQTEPEDLSMNSRVHSPSSSRGDEEEV